jgi:hypothetical protein
MFSVLSPLSGSGFSVQVGRDDGPTKRLSPENSTADVVFVSPNKKRLFPAAALAGPFTAHSAVNTMILYYKL